MPRKKTTQPTRHEKNYLTTEQVEQVQKLTESFMRKYGAKAFWHVMETLDWRERDNVVEVLLSHEETKQDVKYALQSELSGEYYAVKMAGLSLAQKMKLEEFVTTELLPNYADQNAMLFA